MLRRHQSFLTFTAIAFALGVLFGAVWIAVTGDYRPPWWATVIAGVVGALVADQIEQALNRRRSGRARAHVEGPRPTNPDGTPYGYHQIRAGGWKHCDGCGLWGQGWTPEQPHQCQQTLIAVSVTNRKAGR